MSELCQHCETKRVCLRWCEAAGLGVRLPSGIMQCLWNNVHKFARIVSLFVCVCVFLEDDVRWPEMCAQGFSVLQRLLCYVHSMLHTTHISDALSQKYVDYTAMNMHIRRCRVTE